MTAQTPAELLAAFAHPVPEGATIPTRTPYAWMADGIVVYRSNGAGVDIVVDSGDTYWTATPITAPLPTEIGALVIAHTEDNPERRVFLCDRDGEWFDGGAHEMARLWYDPSDLLCPVPAHAVEGVAP